MNRENWLDLAVATLRPLFDIQGSPLPAKIRVSCGFTSSGRRGNRIGECWSDKASADQTVEILISPKIDSPSRVLDILIHELCHAALGINERHGKGFALLASKMGLVPSPKWTATAAGAGFAERYQPVLDVLGAYPHAELRAIDSKPVAPTRLIACLCPGCGSRLWTTQKWIDTGLPLCVNDGQQFQIKGKV